MFEVVSLKGNCCMGLLSFNGHLTDIKWHKAENTTSVYMASVS